MFGNMFDKLYQDGVYNQRLSEYEPIQRPDELRAARSALQAEVTRIEESAVPADEWDASDSDALALRLMKAQNDIERTIFSRANNSRNLDWIIRQNDLDHLVKARAQDLLDEARHIDDMINDASQLRNKQRRERYDAVLAWLQDKPVLLANGWLSLRSSEEIFIHKPYNLLDEDPRKKLPTHHILHQQDAELIAELCKTGDYVFFNSFKDDGGSELCFVLVRRDCVYIPQQMTYEDYDNQEY